MNRNGRFPAYGLWLPEIIDPIMRSANWVNIHQAMLNSKYSDSYRMFLRDGNTHVRDENANTILHVAVNFGHLENVRILCQERTIIDLVNKHNHSPLDLAARNGNTNIIKILLDHGANIEGGNDKYTTSLQHAVENGHIEAIKLLLKSGAKTDYARATRPPLHMACLKEDIPCIRALLNGGCNINDVNCHDETPLITCVIKRKERLVELLIELGADINCGDTFEKTALVHAVRNNDMNMTKLLLKNGANLFHTTKTKFTILHQASLSIIHFDIFKLLIEQGIDVNVANCENETPLMAVIRYYNEPLEAVKYLIEKKANVNTSNNKGRSPLMCAIAVKNVDVIQLLLKYIDDINFQNEDGDTALHLILKRTCWNERNWEIIELLLNNGADINIKNNDNQVPFYYTIQYRYTFFKNYILMLKTANQYVNKENLKLIEDLSDQSILFQSSCEKEILKMKQHWILNIEKPLYYLINYDPSKIRTLEQYHGLMKYCENCRSDYPIYYDFLNCKMKVGLERFGLLMESYAFLHSLDYFSLFPYFILEHVLKYLSNREMMFLLGKPDVLNK